MLGELLRLHEAQLFFHRTSAGCRCTYCCHNTDYFKLKMRLGNPYLLECKI